jgi:hypothetical protein|eukprot:20056-Prymnesium_polylepis.2
MSSTVDESESKRRKVECVCLEATTVTDELTSKTIRYNYSENIVDVKDCLSIACSSYASVSVFQNKHFKDSAINVLWSGVSPRRTRVCCTAEFMVAVLSKAKKDDFKRVLCILKTTLALSNSNTEEDDVRKVREEHNDTRECLVTIYVLIHIPSQRKVYTGRTKNISTRLQQHASKNSNCRLVRNAFRKHGRSSFTIQPLMRCRDSDADANESYWIMKNNTLYPNGYNLRHGSKAGEEDAAHSIVQRCSDVVSFNSMSEEAMACADSWEDIATIVADLDDNNDADTMCKELLKEVHPDRDSSERFYSATEVSQMLNSVRECL